MWCNAFLFGMNIWITWVGLRDGLLYIILLVLNRIKDACITIEDYVCQMQSSSQSLQSPLKSIKYSEINCFISYKCFQNQCLLLASLMSLFYSSFHASIFALEWDSYFNYRVNRTDSVFVYISVHSSCKTTWKQLTFTHNFNGNPTSFHEGNFSLICSPFSHFMSPTDFPLKL